MSYKNDIPYLRAELEKSKRLYSEAVRKQLHTDVEIWSDDIENLKHQIIVHVKAEAWDEFRKRTLMMIDELPRDFQDSNKQIEFHKKALFVMNQCYRAVTHDESEAE